jgi:hypothetical protein
VSSLSAEVAPYWTRPHPAPGMSGTSALACMARGGGLWELEKSCPREQEQIDVVGRKTAGYKGSNPAQIVTGASHSFSGDSLHLCTPEELT